MEKPKGAKQMKKVLIFLAIIIVLFAGIAYVTKMQNSVKSKDNPYGKDTLHPATADLLEDPNYQNLILPDQLEEKLNSKEDLTVYFFSSTCPHCKAATPVLMPLADDLGVDVVQYNLLEFEQGWDDFGIESTPTLVQFKDGKEVARIVGNQPKEEFQSFLEKNTK